MKRTLKIFQELFNLPILRLMKVNIRMIIITFSMISPSSRSPSSSSVGLSRYEWSHSIPNVGQHFHIIFCLKVISILNETQAALT